MLAASVSQPSWSELRNVPERTESEEIFERYLDSQEIRWERLAEVPHKHPDYRVVHNGQACFFEVKEFDDPRVKPVVGL
jgi:hypothetical protein